MISKERTAFIRFALVLMLIFLVSGIALAQEATPETTTTDTNLTYSVPVNGEISNEQYTQAWTLQTASADRISVQVERTGGNLIPAIDILDVNGQSIQSSYGADRTSAAAEIEDYTLPIGGTFQVQVGRLDGDTGQTEGTYTLTVVPLGTAEDNPNNTLVIGPVESDSPISGEVTASHWYQRYSFAAQAGDVILVNAKRTSGTLFPEVQVLDANQTQLQIGYTDYTGDFAQIDRLELSGAGTYTVVVTRQNGYRGNTVGTYDLTVSLIGAGENSPMLAPAAGNDVVYDTPLHGTINARWYDDWKLTAQAGDTISLTVTSDAATSDVEGNLQPEVILLGGSGQELQHAYTDNTGAAAMVNRYHMSGPGTYTVRVSRSGGKTGQTSGPYTLLVTLNGTGEGNPALSEPTGEVETGTAVQGQITDAAWQNIWVYQGEAGASIDVIVDRTDGTLVPMVEIQDANGQSLNTAYYERTQDRAVIKGYTLPGAGQYKIRVYRDSEQDGYTSGGYTLLVQPHSNQ